MTNELTLDDVGREVTISAYHHAFKGINLYGDFKVKIIMGIKGPKGQMFIFEEGNIENQLEAMKFFIKGGK